MHDFLCDVIKNCARRCDNGKIIVGPIWWNRNWKPEKRRVVSKTFLYEFPSKSGCRSKLYSLL